MTACRVCSHPDRREIDEAILAGTAYRVLAERFALKTKGVQSHSRNHLGVTRFSGSTGCPVCCHPERAELETLWLAGGYGSKRQLSSRFGIGDRTIYKHMLVPHLEKDMLRQLSRVKALRRSLSP